MMTQLPLSPAQSTPVPSTDNVPRPLVIKDKKSTLPAFLARLRSAYPNARFYMCAAMVAELGDQPDVTAHRYAQPGECLIDVRGAKT